MPSKKLTKKAVTSKSRASASKSVEKYDYVDFLVVSETRVDHYPGRRRRRNGAAINTQGVCRFVCQRSGTG
jgi:hypothetical protein